MQTRIPSLVNLSEDQNEGSYWSGAFLTATIGQQFIIIHHQYDTWCKSSVLDLSTLEYYKHSVHCTINNDTKLVTADSVTIEFPDFSFNTTAADKISELELFARTPEYSFTLDVESRTSKIVLNGGNGEIAWGPNYSTCTHWSIPAARTSGTLQLGDAASHTLDPSKSFTWYDHQIIQRPPANFTWFGVHFPDPQIRVSIWAYDWPESSDVWRYATVRIGEEQTLVLPFTLLTDWNDVWTSPKSNRTFPQSWTLKFDNGDWLHLKSVKDDQEIRDGSWTGFVTAEKSWFFGQASGIGIADTIYV